MTAAKNLGIFNFMNIMETTAARDLSKFIVPSIKSFEKHHGSFAFKAKILFYADSSHYKTAKNLCKVFKDIFALEAEVVSSEKSSQANIVLKTDSAGVNPESYSILVRPEMITISSPSGRGLFYGFNTLIQLIEQDKSGSGFSVPCCRVEDQPEYQWRGFMLDVCRHFMSIECIKRYIDILSFYKFNRLHLHLTEDQGWRIESRKYPLLTEIGAYRGKSNYGGFYTLEQLRDIMGYAAERFVTVVPEIDLPGHCQAALAAYPELSCTGGPFEVSEKIHVIHEEAFCAGNEKCFEFLQDVFGEIIDALEPKYIHIGADECLKNRWKACSRCQQRMKDEGLADENELQAYFVRRIASFLKSRGITVIGWEEILEGGGDRDTIIQVWKGCREVAKECISNGYRVILSPTSNCYLDYAPAKIDLKKASEFDLNIADSPAEKELVLGGEACMWTEDTPQEILDSEVFPRLLAICESLWHGGAVENYQEFANRLKSHYNAVSEYGIEYNCSFPES
jgi:hexosaminidase